MATIAVGNKQGHFLYHSPEMTADNFISIPGMLRYHNGKVFIISDHPITEEVLKPDMMAMLQITKIHSVHAEGRCAQTTPSGEKRWYTNGKIVWPT